MKHVETHTFTLKFNVNKVNRKLLLDELDLFSEAWPNANVEFGTNWVSIGYTNKRHELAFDAASQFQVNVRRHDWWEEIFE